MCKMNVLMLMIQSIKSCKLDVMTKMEIIRHTKGSLDQILMDLSQLTVCYEGQEQE